MFRKSYPLGAAAIVVVLLALSEALAQTGAKPAAQILAKIAPKILSTERSGGPRQFMLLLADRADLSGAAQLLTRREKGRHVYRALRETADRSQPVLTAELYRLGLKFRTFYISNTILVDASSDRPIPWAYVLRLAQRPDVARIQPVGEVQLPVEPVSAGPAPELTGPPVEWNVRWVGAHPAPGRDHGQRQRRRDQRYRGRMGTRGAQAPVPRDKPVGRGPQLQLV